MQREAGINAGSDKGKKLGVISNLAYMPSNYTILFGKNLKFHHYLIYLYLHYLYFLIQEIYDFIVIIN